MNKVCHHTTSRGRIVLLCLAAAILAADAWAGEIDATKVVGESSQAFPALNTPYNDPDFGTPTVRIGDPSLSKTRPEYSQLQVWNADMSLLLVSGGVILDAKTYQVVHRVDYKYPAWGNGLRWSPTEPFVLYYTGADCSSGGGCRADSLGQQCGTESSRAAVFRRYRLSRQGTTVSAQREVVKCFPEYKSFQKDASFEELSDDGRYVALVGQRPDDRYEAFALDVISNVKQAALALPIDPTYGPRFPDWASVSPSGKYVLLQWGRGARRYQGLEAHDRATMSYAGKVSTSSGHGDATRDADGSDVFISTNANNAELLTDAHYIIKSKVPQGVLVDGSGVVDRSGTLSTGATVPLLRLDWGDNMHISCRNHKVKTWCVVGTYASGTGFANGWQPFEDEVFKVYLDSRDAAPHVDRLAHHRSSPYALSARDGCSGITNYWAQPHATISPDGSKILFGSNWGRICDSSEPIYAFQLTVGAPASPDRNPPAAPSGLRIQ